MYVIGTAGHVDHGKTALIRALTGMDTDRLPEEKTRGMTIDLGFAHFAGPDGRPVGVIDVPGHEGFLRNMVAGISGLDLALLVVSAVEGWQQQTSDHARVLRLLGVGQILVVVNKIDAAPVERVAGVRREAIERCGRFGYTDPPCVEVSALAETNIEALRALIVRELQSVDLSGPERSDAFPLICIDRTFVMKGVGVVVTGTLRGAPVSRGMELLLLPEGRKVRVRSLQCYQEEVDTATPVSRVALNLPGLKKEDLRRGDCLTVEGSPVRVERELLACVVAPPDAEVLELSREVEVEAAFGTGHRLARLYRLDKPSGGGRTGLARLVFAEPVAVSEGQPLLLLRHGGSTIIGGGRVVWTGLSTREQRKALISAARILPNDFGTGRQASLQLALLRLALRGWAPRTEISAHDQEGLVELGAWVMLPGLRGKLEAEMLARAGKPGGVSVKDLQAQKDVPSGLVDKLCDGIIAGGKFVIRQGILRQAEADQLSLSPLAKRLLAELRSSGLAGVELAKTPFPGAQSEIRALAKLGLAVSLDGNIFLEPSVYDGLAARFLDGLAAGTRLSLADAKLRTNLSRKYLIPLLNKLELDGYVRRNGDERIITGRVFVRLTPTVSPS